MAGGFLAMLRERVPGLARIARLPRQLLGRSPFAGDIRPRRVRLLWHRKGSKRGSLPFPHPWNYREPIGIMEAFFHDAQGEPDGGEHNAYLEVPGFAPILMTRDPR